MNLKDIYENIETMVFSENIETIASSYVKILTSLEKLYKERVEEICGIRENNK